MECGTFRCVVVDLLLGWVSSSFFFSVAEYIGIECRDDDGLIDAAFMVTRLVLLVGQLVEKRSEEEDQI